MVVTRQATGYEVAILSLACRFPGADDPETFWRNLRRGVESVTFLPRRELPVPESDDPRYVPAASVLRDAAGFDAGFFGMSPAEARILDPQHRLFLECAHDALEAAGYPPGRPRASVGVFAGASLSSYLIRIYADPEVSRLYSPLQITLANDKDYLTTRVSYKLGLEGPSVGVQTACSTSLVAVHLACQSLLSGECELALAGGVTVKVPQGTGYRHVEGELLSPDGHTRTFDAKASGTIFGSGAGVVLLKRLEDALADGDPIEAVILGSAVNNDGAEKVGYTAPRVETQARVIEDALAAAEVESGSIHLVEAHGTGTPLGDPIEMAALARVFDGVEAGRCAVGSVKTNFGHLESAAGIAGLIKVVLSLRAGEIPPSLHFESPNPEIGLPGSPFYVPTELNPWPRGASPRRAGVSSFGMGGTNAHLVLEEAPRRSAGSATRPWQLLTLSARTPTALERAADDLARHLEAHPEVPIEDAAYTLRVGRGSFLHRRAVVCRDREGAIAGLRGGRSRGAFDGEVGAATRPPPVVFLFPGQGAGLAGVGRDLRRTEMVFAGELDRCAEILQPHLGLDLRLLLFPPEDRRRESEERLRLTSLAQPALFAVSYALAKLWLAWGVEPAVMVGHSLGEYVAACLAGTFTLEDALGLVALRGRLMETLPAGGMLAVPMAEEELRGRLPRELELAAINAPRRAVVSGPLSAIERFADELAAERLPVRRLAARHAFHSGATEPLVERLVAHASRLSLHPPRRRIISAVSGSAADELHTDPEYWGRHLRETVRWSRALETVLREGPAVFLEVGPETALADLVRQQAGFGDGHRAVATLRALPSRQGELPALLGALGRLWTAGVAAEPEPFYESEARRRVKLPTYPFERQRFWIDPPAARPELPAAPASPPARDVGDWFWIPRWVQSARPAGSGPPADGGGPWLLLTDEGGLGEKLAARLRRDGRRVVLATRGDGFARIGTDAFVVDPRRRSDFASLLDTVGREGDLPSRVVHLWGMDQGEALVLGFWTMIHLAVALGEAGYGHPWRLDAVTMGLYRVTPADPADPARATVLGPLRVIPHELPGTRCRLIDVAPPGRGEPTLDGLAETLVHELAVERAELVVAYRGGWRWVQELARVRFESPIGNGELLRERGVYWITGGTGGVGWALARELARGGGTRLVLSGRRVLPPREEWPARLRSSEDPGERRAIGRVLDLEEAGAEVIYVAADVADRERMEAALEVAKERFGAIHGVVHAAGVPGGGILQTREPDEVERVLAPKVRGTEVLAEVTRDEPLDFFFLLSSTLSWTGAPGQVDYCAANAYLDAFAQARFRPGKPLVASLGWDLWGELGMGVDRAASAGRSGAAAAGGEPAGGEHPLLGRRIEAGPGEIFHLRELRPETHWALAEHRVLGKPVLPGTAFLEMARAAAEPLAAGRGIAIEDMTFLEPLQVDDGSSLRVESVLRCSNGEEAHAFTVRSRPDEGAPPRVHATARVSFFALGQEPRHELSGLLAPPAPADPVLSRSGTGLVQWGPHWRSVRCCRVGEDLVGLEVSRPEEEGGRLPLDPAVLDVATSVGLAGMEGGPYLPLAYRSVRIAGRLPHRLWVRVRRGGPSRNGEVVSFDLQLIDERGVERVSIQEFTLRRVRGAGPGRGLTTSEGAEAFRRLLGGLTVPHVVISSRPLDSHGIARKGTAEERAGDGAQIGADGSEPASARAVRGTGEALEDRLARLWQDTLGFKTVGLDDDFFELGGDSLKGLQLLARMREEGLSLSPRQLFEHSSIRRMADVLGEPGRGTPAGGDADAPAGALVTSDLLQAGHPPAELDVLPTTAGAGPVDVYPLTPLQEGLVFHCLHTPREGLYIDQVVARLRRPGGIDGAALRSALGVLVERHTVLRTGLLGHERERPLQAVFHAVAVPMAEVDARAEPGERLERELASEERLRGFDLARPPLLRVVLLRREPGHDVLILTYHHAVLDAWSVRVLLAELVAAYRAAERGEPPRLEPAPPFRSYVDWLADQSRETTEGAWRSLLAGFREPTRVPGARETMAEGSPSADDVSLRLTRTQTEALERRVRPNRLTLASVFHAAWGLLLARYGGTDDVVFGVTVSGRAPALPGVERMLGLFINTLPFRLEVPAAGALVPWLQAVTARQFTLATLEHSPLVEVQGWSEVTGGTPLFETLLVFENVPERLPSLERTGGSAGTDLDIELEPYRPRTHYPMNLVVEPGECLSIRLLFTGDRVDRSSAARVLDHLTNLLDGMASVDDVADLSLLSRAELHQVLRGWNRTGRELPEGATVHGLFRARAAAAPSAEAVACGGQRLTYGELAARTEALAVYLRGLGVGPETLVGVHLERSLDMVVAVLGVLEAGAAYVPLDPEYPAERIGYMLESSRFPVILSQAALAEKLPLSGPSAGPRVVRLDAEWSHIVAAAAQGGGETPDAGPDALAYVIYTSGSTGKPKGVQVTHRSVVNFLLSMAERPGFRPGDALCAVTTLSFDIAGLELYLPLVTGGRVVIASREAAQAGDLLLQRVRETSPAVMQATPATWRLLLDSGWDGPPPARILCGGEALPRELADRLLARGAELWNLYGPTESTIWSAALRVEEGREAVPVGGPIANTTFYVLDRRLSPVPVGVPGELLIGGVGLARGYLRRPGLTAELFLPDPYATQRGARAYRTGDLVRWRADGTLAFLGRIDHQVKVRGFRIEPGEIEAALLRDRRLSAAVVLPRTRPDGDQDLVAYVVPREEAPAVAVLREALEGELPRYMVPTAFVVLPELPRLPNGKLDRRALAPPDRGADRLGGRRTAPRTPEESLVVEIWEDVLGVPGVGVDESFFDLGGHSLLAARVLSRLRRVFGTGLPVRALFDAPTVRELSRLLRSERRPEGPPQDALVPLPREGPEPLSFAQERLWVMHRLNPASSAYNVPVALALRGELSLAVLDSCLRAVVRRHEPLRSRFPESPPLRVEIAAEGGAILRLVDLGKLPERVRREAAASVLRCEVRRPFSLARGPLLRAVAVRLGRREHRLVLTLHHIACDGWSLEVLVRELTELYRGRRRGRPVRLPPLPIRYGDYARWQRSWLQGEVLDHEIEHWRRTLSGAPPVVTFPPDRARPASRRFEGATVRAVVEPELAEALQGLARTEGATLFMVLLTALNVLLHRCTGLDDVVVGTDTANRNHLETEGLIGLLVNNVALRCHLAGNPTFRGLLTRVRAVALDAFAHSEVPFERVVSALAPRRDPSYAPLFQVLFVHQNVPGARVDLEDLELVSVPLDFGAAKFDVAVFVQETGRGFTLFWSYSTDLYRETTVASWVRDFLELLRQAAAAPDLRLDDLELFAPLEMEETPMETSDRSIPNPPRRGRSRRSAVALEDQATMVRTFPLLPDHGIPLCIEPALPDIDLADWATGDRGFIEDLLLRHGALLFRGFSVASAAEFARFAEALVDDLFGEYGDLPSEDQGQKIYRSTPYPADKAILFHNESSHMHRWPLKQWFYCDQPAATGGETPIVDCREMYRRLDPTWIEELRAKGLLYVRNFIPGVDVSWQDFFRTSDRGVVEEHCRASGIECEWRGDGLRTCRRCHAVARHPKTGDPLLFNQMVLHHVSCLDADLRRSMLALYAPEDIPRNVFYGDGSPIPDQRVYELLQTYWETSVSFPWQKGDVLLVDNMLVAHARKPFTGQRKILVAMGEMFYEEPGDEVVIG